MHGHALLSGAYSVRYMHISLYQCTASYNFYLLSSSMWGSLILAPRRRAQQVKICIYLCTYVCIYVQFAQIKLVQLMALYDYELRAVCKNHHVHSSRYCTEHEQSMRS